MNKRFRVTLHVPGQEVGAISDALVTSLKEIANVADAYSD